jgi:SAM-dependent methyltransferase
LRDIKKSILEVGCGPYGLAYQLSRPVQGVELNPVKPQSEWLKIQQGSILELPFQNDSFDYVLCVDVLEHLANADRAKAISELVRVAKEKAIISCPFDYPGAEGENALAEWYDKKLVERPDWLREHLVNGLPKLSEVVAQITAIGLPFDLFGNEGMLQHYAGILLDFDFPLSQQLLEHQRYKNPFEAPIAESDWDHFYSYGICLHKDIPIPLPRAYRDAASGNVDAVERGKVGVYAACHDLALLDDFGKITPLFTGAAASHVGSNALTDILSTGKRLQNNRWSEMSGVYKVWQEGPKTDVVGFCHYRRFFDFSNPGVKRHRSVIKKSEVVACNRNFLHEDVLRYCLDGYVFLPFPNQVGLTPFRQYAFSYNANDLCKIFSLMSKKAPELLPYTHNILNGDSFYSFNMFVMQWDLFDDLCKVWFGLLLEFEEMVPAGRASDYQNRDISFLAERIFDVWIRYAADKRGVKFAYTPTYFVET